MTVTPRRIGLIHTVASLVPTFKSLIGDVLGPHVESFNVVDETLLRQTIAQGHLSPETMRRLVDYVATAEREGADLILVTCSSLGPAVDAAQPLTRTPLLRVDEAMVDAAISVGPRIGVLATLTSTLAPTVALIERKAGEASIDATVVPLVCENAFELLSNGDVEGHDGAVRAGLHELTESVDVVVLAQASMARVAEGTGGGPLRVPVISSPRLAIARVAELLGAMEDT